MATDVSYSNTYMVYIDNGLYEYADETRHVWDAGQRINTGWQIIPTMKWSHFLTPKQFAHLQIANEAIHVEGYKITLFNMIPMMTQLSFGSQQIWTSFNNTIYCLGYRDKYYETSWQNWWDDNIQNSQPNLAQKEGMLFNSSTSKIRFKWPTYYWKSTNTRIYNAFTFGVSIGEQQAYDQEGEQLDDIDRDWETF